MAAHSSPILAILLVLFAAVAGAQSLSPGMTRVAVVTGANKGIGRAIAEHLACSGIFTDVILGCRNEQRGSVAANEIASNPNASRSCAVRYHQLTIGDKASHAAFAKFVEGSYGKVDVLVNNAGIAFKNADPTPFEQQCKPTLAVNFWGTVDFTEQMLPLVRKGRDARIVSVASMAGHLGQLRSRELQRMFSSPQLTKAELCSLVDKFEADVMNGRHVQEGWGNSNYGFSKLAVIAATKIWAREEAANGIAVNCCCPGYCDTDMTSHRGPRSPWEGAKNAVIPATMENPPTGEYFADFRVARW
ncbi:hypothetical protein ACHAXT_012320 [Thalassiosira profunda]